MLRRNFIQSIVGGIAIAGNISFASEVKEKDTAQNGVLFIWLGGGASHIETFNPIPHADANRRSVTGSINTNVNGIRIGGLFKNIANQADKYAIVHNFGHRDANHSSATHWLMTGEMNFGQGESQKWPSYGSVVSGVHGPSVINSGLPTYIKMRSIEHDDAAWMGGKYVGYDATQEGRNDLKLGLGEDHFKYRLRLLEELDKDFGKGHLISKQWKDLRTQAVDVVVGSASKAFEVEKDVDYDLFKSDRFGIDLLTSIRLLENGCKFVTISFDGWDMHNNIKAGLENRQVILDNFLSLLFSTLEKRGLDSRIMTVVTTEFGRTSQINKEGGRDHQSVCTPLLLACKSYEMGRIIGQTNREANEIIGDSFAPKDLRNTIFEHLGIKLRKWTSLDNRPMDFFGENTKNILI